MPRNTITGKNTAPSSNKKTGRKYGASQLRSNRKNQDKRVELNREARKRKIYGKRYKAGKDLSHSKNGSLALENRARNRSRNGKDGKSTKR